MENPLKTALAAQKLEITASANKAIQTFYAALKRETGEDSDVTFEITGPLPEAIGEILHIYLKGQGFTLKSNQRLDYCGPIEFTATMTQETPNRHTAKAWWVLKEKRDMHLSPLLLAAIDNIVELVNNLTYPNQLRTYYQFPPGISRRRDFKNHMLRVLQGVLTEVHGISITPVDVDNQPGFVEVELARTEQIFTTFMKENEIE